MAAIPEAQRVHIRKYMGWPPGHTEPRYDSQIVRIQSTADGGVMPDSSTADELLRILGLLCYPVAGTAPPQGVLSIEARLSEQHDLVTVASADDARSLDAGRGLMLLRSEGRRLVMQMAIVLDAPPLVDIFSGAISRPIPTNLGHTRSPSPYGAG